MNLSRYLITIIATAIVAILGSSLYFKSQLGEHNDSALALVNKLTHNNVNIIKQFHVPHSTLQGFVVAAKNNTNARQVLYTNRTGRLLFSGTLLNNQGQDVSQIAYKKYIAPKTAGAAYSKIAQTHWFSEGKLSAPHKLYAVIDPNCIFCHHFYEAVQPLIKSGQLTVRWLVIGFLKPSSPAKAITILNASNPAKAMAQNEASFNEKTEEGGIKETKKPTATEKAKLDFNNKFAQSLQIMQTPTIFYKTDSGQTHMQAGYNPKTLKQLIQNSGSKF